LKIFLTPWFVNAELEPGSHSSTVRFDPREGVPGACVMTWDVYFEVRQVVVVVVVMAVVVVVCVRVSVCVCVCASRT